MSNYYDNLKKYQNNNGYYIHLHSKNIGRMYGKSVELTEHFNNYKDKIKNDAIIDYKSNMIGKIIDINNKTLTGIDELFEGENDFSYFDEQVRKSLESGLDAGGQLEILYNETHKKNFGDIFLRKNQLAFKEYNELMKFFSELTKITISGDGGHLLAQAFLSMQINGEQNQLSASRAGKHIKAMIEQLNGTLINEKDIQKTNAIVNELNKLSNSLMKGTNDEGHNLTSKSINKICQNIISAGFAESILQDIPSFGILNMENAVGEALGMKPAEIKLLNGKTRKLSQGKVDTRLKNVSASFSAKGSEKERHFQLQLDLSSKFYLTNLFKGIAYKGKKNERESVSKYGNTYGSGGTYFKLGDLINLTFQDNFDRYLVYNAFATLQETSAINAIQESILIRNINKFFSGQSKEDFNSYLVVNGNVISLWQMINMALKTNVGYSKSISKKEQPISLTIPKSQRDKIKNDNKYINEKHGMDKVIAAWARSRKVNIDINKTSVQAVVNAAAMRNAYTKLNKI